MQFTPSISRVTVDSASKGRSASGERSWFPFQRYVNFQKARTQIRNLESFQVRGCSMVRYKDSDHAFLVGVLFVLMFVWLSAFVCICSVCHRLHLTVLLSVSISVSRNGRVCFSVCFCAVFVRVPVSYIVCELPSLSAQCALETVVALCSWAALTYLMLVCPVWFCLRVTSLCCIFVVFTLPLVLLRSFILRLFRWFVLCTVPALVHKASHVQVSSHANAKNAHLQSCQKNTLTPAKLPSDDTILRSSATPMSAVTSSGPQQRRAPIGGR